MVKKPKFETFITLRFSTVEPDVLKAISWESNLRNGEAVAELLVDAITAEIGYIRD